jgi:hypothetical protein
MEVLAREFLGFAKEVGATAQLVSSDIITLADAEAEVANASRVFKSDGSAMLRDLLETVDSSKLDKDWYAQIRESSDRVLADGDVSAFLENISTTSNSAQVVDAFNANRATIWAVIQDIIVAKSPTSLISREELELTEDTANFDKIASSQAGEIDDWLFEINEHVEGLDDAKPDFGEAPTFLSNLWKGLTVKTVGGIVVAGSLVDFLLAYKRKHSGAFLVTRVGNGITKQRVKDISCGTAADPGEGDVPYPNNSATIVRLMGNPREGMCHNYLQYSRCGGWEKWATPQDRLPLLLAQHLLPPAVPLPLSTTIVCQNASIKDAAVALVKAAAAESGEIVIAALEGLSSGLGITQTIGWGISGVLATASAVLCYKLSQPWFAGGGGDQVLCIILSVLAFFAVMGIMYILVLRRLPVSDRSD